jgi:hypothetical protein
MFDAKTLAQPTNVLRRALDANIRKETRMWPVFGGGHLMRKSYVSSSEVGKCLRMAFFNKRYDDLGCFIEADDLERSPLGGNMDTLPKGFITGAMPGNWGYAERGNAQEEWLVTKLRGGVPGTSFMFLGSNQVSFVDGNRSGTPDGLAVRPKGDFTLEFKSYDPRKKMSSMPVLAHIAQVIQNTDLMQIAMPARNLVGGLLTYTEASDYNKGPEFWIDTKAAPAKEYLADLKVRADTVFTASAPDELPAEGIHNGDCQYCPHTARCSAAGTMIKQEKANRDRAIDIARTIFSR